MNERRRELGQADRSKLGGRPRRPSVGEARREALRELEPKAVQVLREQLESGDESVRHRAAVKVLEYVRGRPAQTLVHDHDQPLVVEYRTAALPPE